VLFDDRITRERLRAAVYYLNVNPRSQSLSDRFSGESAIPKAHSWPIFGFEPKRSLPRSLHYCDTSDLRVNLRQNALKDGKTEMVKHKMHVFLRPLSVACLLLAASCGEDATQQIHGRASTDIVTLNVEEMPVSTSEKARDCSTCRRFSFDLLVGNHAVCGAYVEHLESTVMRHPFCHMKNEKVTGEIIPLEKAGLSDASLAELVANVDAYRPKR